jgi:hypothetical protein
MVFKTARDILRESMRFRDKLCQRFKAGFGTEYDRQSECGWDGHMFNVQSQTLNNQQLSILNTSLQTTFTGQGFWIQLHYTSPQKIMSDG